MKSVNPNRVADVLNGLLALDPAACTTLVTTRVPYAGDLNKTAPITVYDDGKGGPPLVGVLGVINGILASAGCKLYAYADSETGRLTEFVVRNNIEREAGG
jgi:hypothetical protein